MTPVDASNNPDKVKYSFIYRNIKPKLKVVDYVRNADKVISSLRDTLLIGIESCLKLMRF